MPIAAVGQLRSPTTTCTLATLKGTTAAMLVASRARVSPSASVMRPIDVERRPDCCVACGQM